MLNYRLIKVTSNRESVAYPNSSLRQHFRMSYWQIYVSNAQISAQPTLSSYQRHCDAIVYVGLDIHCCLWHVFFWDVRKEDFFFLRCIKNNAKISISIHIEHIYTLLAHGFWLFLSLAYWYSSYWVAYILQS